MDLLEWHLFNLWSGREERGNEGRERERKRKKKRKRHGKAMPKFKCVCQKIQRIHI